MIGLSFAAIMVRPAYLSLIPFLLIAGTLLGQMSGESWKRGVVTSAGLTFGVCVCVLAWMGLRGAVVSDFGVLPFGHQNLAGVTFQLVGDEELLAVAPESRELLEQILVARDTASQRGLVLADPGGQAGMTAATMTIEARWNDLIYQAIVPAVNSRYPGDPVAAHRELAKINRAIVMKYPLRYARWLVLASRRAVWGTMANWMMNPFFLAATGVVVGRGLWRAILVQGEIQRDLAIGDTQASESETNRGDTSGAGPPLFVVAITYAVVMIGFVILTTPPLGRFSDAGAILIPAWLAFRGAETFRNGC